LNGILLTPYTGKILGPIANYILGPIINVLFIFLDKVFGKFDSGLVGFVIILFTIVIYLLMLPLTIKQQKFSKLSAKINPEIQAVQAKYKDKKDNDSIMAMNAEVKAVYAKYGVSQTGSCVQLLIQMPIFFALYRVIYSLPAYIGTIKEKFEVIANYVIANGMIDQIKELKSSANYLKNFEIDGNQVNAVIDCLNAMNASELSNFVGNNQDCINAFESIKTYNYFLGLNLSNSPSFMIKDAWTNPSGIQWGIIIASVLIPVLAGVSQWLNVKLMPQQEPSQNSNQSETAQSMTQSMKMMNNIMPLFSVWLCFSFSAGVGLYWIAGSVVRSIQQVVINKQIDKIDFDEVVKKNEEKRREKLKKAGLDPDKVDKYAKMNTKNISNTATTTASPKKSISEKASFNNSVSKKEENKAMQEAIDSNSSKSTGSAGSLAAKANLVNAYNNRDNTGDK